MDRRSFLSSLAVLGLQGCLLNSSAAARRAAAGGSKRQRGAVRFDDNLVCLISDLHTNPGSYQPGRLERTVADILALNPLPHNVIALGDLAYLTGKPEEYALLKEIIAPLEAAGIQVTLAMGNHDKRANFAEAFPTYASASQMKERFVFVVETPRADFIVLDSLQESTSQYKWITPGAIDDAQREWLKDKLATYTTKPVFVMSHHPLNEVGIKDLLQECPSCCGYIHGHDHVWRPGWIKKNYHEQTVVRTLLGRHRLHPSGAGRDTGRRTAQAIRILLPDPARGRGGQAGSVDDDRRRTPGRLLPFRLPLTVLAQLEDDGESVGDVDSAVVLAARLPFG